MSTRARSTRRKSPEGFLCAPGGFRRQSRDTGNEEPGVRKKRPPKLRAISGASPFRNPRVDSTPLRLSFVIFALFVVQILRLGGKFRLAGIIAPIS